MSQLYLVRHAQASFFGSDYDALSPLGLEQATALGRHFAAHRVEFAATYVGPRRRHRETWERVADAYRAAGLHFPEPTELAELDEHQGTAVIKQRLGHADVAGPALHAADVAEADRERLRREFYRHYDEGMRDWARGTTHIPGIESWADFRARSLRALDRLCAGGGTGSRVAFTSGGFVASAAGWVLGVDDDRVIDLSMALRNTALTEIRWTGRRRRLVSFNTLPHLPDPRSATSV